MESIFTGQRKESIWRNPRDVLKYVSEKDIFELVFESVPDEFTYVTSPFREDNNPGCWFEVSLVNGKLMFVDFASETVLNGVKLIRMDCFDAVRVYYNLRDFPSTIKFIEEKLIEGKSLPERESVNFNGIKREVVNSRILVAPRNFISTDYEYWFKRYHISKDNLMSDSVFPVSGFKIEKPGEESKIIYPTDISYCISGFDNGNVKIYRPTNRNRKARFISTCSKNDVGGLGEKTGKLLVITKSYKDYRVLKNLGVNSRWFQSESMVPDPEILFPLCFGFDQVVVLFDNDETGLNNSRELVRTINSYMPAKARKVYIPTRYLQDKIKDPSDIIHKLGKKSLIDFLAYNKLLN